MKRTTTVAATAAAVIALLLSGCSSEEEPSRSSGTRENTAATQTESESGATGETATPDEDTATPDEDTADPEPVETESTPADDGSSTGPRRASDTTCAEFAALDEPGQEQLVRSILDENPDSSFVDNPNAALSTAKLVCNAGEVADQLVAVVAGIVRNG